jgi:hypothetical protein
MFLGHFVSYCPQFWFPGWFCRPMTLSTYLIGMTKNLSFLCLWPFLCAIAHCFGVMGGFTWPVTLSTCLRGMTKNLSFLHFWAIFVSYSPQFWVFGVISSPWHLVLIWYAWPKTHHFCIYGHFYELLPTVWGSRGFTWPMTLSTCLWGMTKNSLFLRFRAVFMSYCPLFWVSEVIYKAHDTH